MRYAKTVVVVLALCAAGAGGGVAAGAAKPRPDGPLAQPSTRLAGNSGGCRPCRRSGWVNAALVERAARDRRLEALAAAIANYETEFGEITREEIASLQRADRENAVVVRGRRPRPKGTPGRAGRGAA